MISSNRLSIARGHSVTNISGSPITMMMASISAAKFINICCLEYPRSSVLSTHMWAVKSFSTPLAVKTPLLISHANMGSIGVPGSSSAYPIMSRNFLCFRTRSG